MSLMVRGWWRNVCGYLDPQLWSKSQTTSFHLEGFPLHVQCCFPPVFPLCLLGKVLEFSEIYHNLCCFLMCTWNPSVGLFYPDCSFSFICHITLTLFCVKLSSSTYHRSPTCSMLLCAQPEHNVIRCFLVGFPNHSAVKSLSSRFLTWSLRIAYKIRMVWLRRD